jgi:Leucine-rich repeat (LRR) protein
MAKRIISSVFMQTRFANFLIAKPQLTFFSAGDIFRNLLSLDLSSNYIETIDDILLPRSLKYLNLACNYLKQVSVSRLVNLETLILSYNSLSSSPNPLPGTLANLDLRHNSALSDPPSAVGLKHLLIDDRHVLASRKLLPRLLSLNDNSIFLSNASIYTHPPHDDQENKPAKSTRVVKKKKSVLMENNSDFAMLQQNRSALLFNKSNEYAQYVISQSYLLAIYSKKQDLKYLI